MSGSYCLSCFSSLECENASFCPQCGGVIITGSVVESSTTASYDPLSREWKPWREKPMIPKRNYRHFQGKPKPWFPSMKVHFLKIQSKPIPSMTLSTVDHDSIDQNTTTASEDTTLSDRLKDKNSDESVDTTVQRQHHSTGVSESVWLPSATTAAAVILPAVRENHLAMTELATIADLREVIYPLAAYECQTSVTNGVQYVMVLSLIEQLYGSLGYPRQYWLRVTTRQGNDDLHDDPSSSTLLSQLSYHSDTVYLSNTICSLIYPFEEWLDLEKVQYMQKTLQFLPFRLSKKRFYKTLTVPPTKISDFIAIEAKVVIEPLASSVMSVSYGRKQSNKMVVYHERHRIEQSDCEDRVVFDDVLMEHQSMIMISRALPSLYLPVMVRSTPHYRKRFNGAEILTRTTKEQLRASGRASHLHLQIIPCEDQRIIDGEQLPILDMSIEQEVLQQLLLPACELEDTLLACEGNLEEWKFYVDRVLSAIRLEYSVEHGIVFTVVGCFSQPSYTSHPWPEDLLVRDPEGSDES
eukprot:scaffold147_cov164-Ochromonas_danica.AAC.5